MTFCQQPPTILPCTHGLWMSPLRKLNIFLQLDYEKPSVKIGVEIISSDDNTEFKALIDTWWKILAWSLAVLTLSCLCCYFSRCCYLCYDCCSDPFWGCCPHSTGCTRFLLMKGNYPTHVFI